MAFGNSRGTDFAVRYSDECGVQMRRNEGTNEFINPPKRQRQSFRTSLTEPSLCLDPSYPDIVRACRAAYDLANLIVSSNNTFVVIDYQIPEIVSTVGYCLEIRRVFINEARVYLLPFHIGRFPSRLERIAKWTTASTRDTAFHTSFCGQGEHLGLNTASRFLVVAERWE